MAISFDGMANSGAGLGIAMGLGRSLPPSIGPRVARGIARLVVAADGPMVEAVRADQRMVADGVLAVDELEERTRDVFQHIAMSLYDLYHRLDDPEALDALVRYAPGVRQRIEEWKREERGVCFVGPHMAGFDLVLRSLASGGLRPQTLSVPSPSSSHRRENEFRRQVGLEVTPIGPDALRRAVARLRDGGHVVTGADFPVPGSGSTFGFFGAPAALPTVHVRLALSTGAPVVMLHSRRTEEGLYELRASEPVEMTTGGDRRETIRLNTERILGMVEACIRETPTQWCMTHPVWSAPRG